MDDREYYWKVREYERLKMNLKDVEDVAKLLDKSLRRTQSEIEKNIHNLYAKYAKDNELSYTTATEKLTSSEFKNFRFDLEEYVKRIKATNDEKLLFELNTLSTKSQISRLELMMYDINKALNADYQYKSEVVKDLLIKGVKDNFEYAGYAIDMFKGKHSTFNRLDLNEALRIAEIPWSGKNYSQRLWSNTKKLSDSLEEHITQSIVQGKSLDKVVREMRGIFDASKSVTKRLVNTEHAYACEQGTLKMYEEIDVEEYEIFAVLDTKTSQICRNLDGSVYETSKATVGFNYPPFHPHCRTTTVPYLDDEDIDDEDNIKIAKDTNGKVIYLKGDTTYKEYQRALSTGDWDSIRAKKQVTNKENLLEKVVIEKDLKKLIEKMDLTKATHSDIIELGRIADDKHKVSEMIGDREKLKNFISKYREVGGYWDKEMFYEKSASAVKKQINNVLSVYPSDWVKIPKSQGMKIFAKKEKRGYFVKGLVSRNRYMTDVENYMNYYTICSDERAEQTMFHELGHMVEDSNEHIGRLCREWRDSRTKGEKLTRLSDLFRGFNYGVKEVTKADNFITPYIGKEYGDGSTEVLSVGLENLFSPDLRGALNRVELNEHKQFVPTFKNLRDDIEYLHFIVGILLKG